MGLGAPGTPPGARLRWVHPPGPPPSTSLSGGPRAGPGYIAYLTNRVLKDRPRGPIYRVRTGPGPLTLVARFKFCPPPP